jgi:hypothetical protein
VIARGVWFSKLSHVDAQNVSFLSLVCQNQQIFMKSADRIHQPARTFFLFQDTKIFVWPQDLRMLSIPDILIGIIKVFSNHFNKNA